MHAVYFPIPYMITFAVTPDIVKIPKRARTLSGMSGRECTHKKTVGECLQNNY